MRAVRQIGAALALACGLGQAAGAETLADTLIAAYKNSNLLAQNEAVLRAADENVAVAVSALRPTIGLSGGPTYSNLRLDQLQDQISLSAELTLFDFGRNRLAIDSQKETVLATRQALVAVEQQVLLGAVSAYVNVRLTQDIVGLRGANVRLITQELRAARDRFEVGEVTRTDVAQAESSLATAQSDLISAQGDAQIARENFRLAVGRYPGNLAPPPRPPGTARSLEEARSIAVRTHPSILQGQHTVSASEVNVARAKAQFGPTVSGSVSIARNDKGLDSRQGSITLNQTLYAGGQLSALYRQSLANRDQSRAGLLQTTAEVSQAVGQAWANVTVAVASIDATQRAIAAAQTAFEGVREEARLGSRTTLDVLDAEQKVLAARTNRVSAEASRYIGIYTLLSSMGLLTVDHLKLGIPTYDPAAYYNAVKNAPATSSRGKKLDKILEKIGR